MRFVDSEVKSAVTLHNYFVETCLITKPNSVDLTERLSGENVSLNIPLRATD